MLRRRWVIPVVLAAAALMVARGLVGRQSSAGGARGSPHAAEGAAVPGAPARLRLATWNIAWLAGAEGRGHVRRDAADYARLRGYAARIDADLIALQEVEGPEAVRRLFDEATWDLHLTDDPGNAQRTGFVFRRTLAVTRHPDVVALAISGRRRGADMSVHLQGGDLRLLAIHLKSGCQVAALDSGREECAILGRQMRVLEDWIDTRARETAAFAVIGDFNRSFEPPDRFWDSIDDGDPPEADLVSVTEGRKPTCWGGRYPSFIDHIVLGRKASAWIVPGSFHTLDYAAADARHEATLSDHCPLAIELDSLRPPPVAPPTVTASGAAGHAGEYATVCGRVAGARFMDRLRGRPTFLNLDRPYPDQPFTVVIWGDDRDDFGAPETAFAGRRICATGLIRLHQGRPEIVARRRSDIVIADGEAATPAAESTGKP